MIWHNSGKIKEKLFLSGFLAGLKGVYDHLSMGIVMVTGIPTVTIPPHIGIHVLFNARGTRQ
jgi:hypothetical protein